MVSAMDGFFHVTSSRNRLSIARHGLDWTRMSSVSGIAGSRTPEQQGIFLCCDESEVGWFCRMNATGGPLDVWSVEGVDVSELVESPEHYFFLPRPVPPSRLKLVMKDVDTPGNFG
jgi:hypothetical protein